MAVARPTQVFFDLGDTLVDLGDLVPAMARQVRDGFPSLAEKAGVIARSWVIGTAEATSKAQGPAFRPGLEIAGSTLSAAFRTAGKELSLREAVDMAQNAWKLYLQRAKFCDDVTPGLLRSLRAKTELLGIITDSDTSVVEPLLSRLNIRRIFDVVIVSESVGAYKPSPRIYLAALEKGGGTARDAAFVSNSLLDLQGAEAVGMRAVWVRRGRLSPEAMDLRKTLVIDDLRGLPRTLFDEE